MSPLAIIVMHTFAAGALGILARLYISAFLLSTESVDSPRGVTRFFFRYMIASFHYMVSFMLTPLMIKPFVGYFRSIPAQEDAKSYLYLALCIPLAALLYFLDHKVMRWGDARKLEGRERLRKISGQRYRRNGSA
ncbi:hypothetical protein HIV01_005025 [Lysobacter arenosi]|uniref:Uncharacterized protein n=1 Tax=Lysobacter arenosi TaxID=2795387 RepID=A0ABX7RCI8_9GAMM|nr:hypothetical protein [Lysobacter arenosi]QSX75873.1 hypothetical protein HIV01_005025 [Lysobacter arenosi]